MVIIVTDVEAESGVITSNILSECEKPLRETNSRRSIPSEIRLGACMHPRPADTSSTDGNAQ